MSYRAIPDLFTTLMDMYQADRSPSEETLVNLILICLGRTGCGSSTFINRLIQESADPGLDLMGVGSGLTSSTAEIRWTQLVPRRQSESTKKYNIIIGDMPGLDNNCSPRSTDFDTIRGIRDSLRQRIQPGNPFQLGVLLLQDITEQRWPSLGFPNDVTWLAANVDPGLLRGVTFATTKWSTIKPMASSGQCTSTNQDDPEGRHAELRALTTPLRSEGAGMKACKGQGDEWRIVYEMVDRINQGSGSFLLPKQRSPIRRLVGKICCV